MILILCILTLITLTQIILIILHGMLIRRIVSKELAERIGIGILNTPLPPPTTPITAQEAIDAETK